MFLRSLTVLSTLLLCTFGLQNIASAETHECTGECAWQLYQALPGPVLELTPSVHQKATRDRSIVCTRSDYMLGESEFECSFDFDRSGWSH